MSTGATAPIATRRPRFRRAMESPAFRVTEDDIAIIRQIARHRFLRSNHIAALVGRSIDRTNDRLCNLYHAGYIDRPRAQLDYYPAGSAPITYALADRGARLLCAHDGIDLAHIEWSRKNREAGRPFIEHQLEIIDFQVAMQQATERAGHRFIDAGEIVATRSSVSRNQPDPFAMCVAVTHDGRRHEIGLVPDLGFALGLASGARRNFLVEIDRGSMPITRSDFSQTSIERKLRCYLAANAARLPERQFGWKAFRVLTVTSDRHRVHSMIEALQSIQPPGAAGSSLFLFIARDELRASDPLNAPWRGADGQVRPLL